VTYADDREAYTNNKTTFVEAVVKKALEQGGQTE
jgi:hypothetical protein